ncbi:DNA repair protein RadA [Thermoproteota archaeon]
MEKQIIQYTCQNCGASFPRWQGQCSICTAWNSLEEERTMKRKIDAFQLTAKAVKKSPIPIETAILDDLEIIPSGMSELDHVLGNGFVKGSVVLIGGEPGIGKSTIALQTAQHLAGNGQKVLYISGEESEGQLKIRASRVGQLQNPTGPQLSEGFPHSNLFVLSETDMAVILQAIEQTAPDVVILDSIQVVYHPSFPSISGSINQVRQCANAVISWAKQNHSLAVIIGHITKDGSLAGPKTLEHLVDVILYFEGERSQQYRLLRSFKNRYANTHEIGVFEMTEKGLKDIINPSTLFFDENTCSHPGSVVAAVAEGSRILLVEIQALVLDSGYGMAKRTFLGVDPNRANLMIAAIEKILGIKLSGKDIIINIIGGLKIYEPALDLAIVAAILSSLQEHKIGEKTGVFGEVGLTGEIRMVPHFEKRVSEFEKLGFTKCLVPHKNKTYNKTKRIQVNYLKTLRDVLENILG